MGNYQYQFVYVTSLIKKIKIKEKCKGSNLCHVFVPKGSDV